MEAFIECNDCDDQGSDSWLNRTKFSWGGSSIHGLITNPANALVNRITDDCRFSNIAMDFGSLFENVIRVYLSMITKAPIHVLGAVPFLKDEKGRLNAHYSMDGMLRANLHHLKGRDGEDLFPNEELVYLLEIKTPWSRELKAYKKNTKFGPKGSCNIPLAYKSQVKMGLVVITPCQLGIFVDCFARICCLTDLNKEREFEISPIHSTPRNDITQVLASGIVKFYIEHLDKTSLWGEIETINDFYKLVPKTLMTQDLINTYKTQHDDFEERDPIDPIDFGPSPKSILRAAKEDDKNSTPYIKRVYVVNEGLSLPDIDNTEPFLIGYLPWKIFDMYYGLVDKEPGFLDEHIDIIKKTSSFCYETSELSLNEKLDLLEVTEL